MSADTLTISSRAFFERSKMKVAFSIVVSAFGLMLLAFCASVGGQASSARYVAKGYSSSSDYYDAQQALQSGYGFAAFCFISAFIMMVAAAIYISPLFCGSNNEVKMIRAPQEIDSGYSAYSENPAASAPNV